jgi:hypothetical protein
MSKGVSSMTSHPVTKEELEQYMEFPERRRCHKDLSSHDTAIRNATLDDFAQWVKTEWVQESIKDYKETLSTKEQP